MLVANNQILKEKMLIFLSVSLLESERESFVSIIQVETRMQKTGRKTFPQWIIRISLTWDEDGQISD